MGLFDDLFGRRGRVEPIVFNPNDPRFRVSLKKAILGSAVEITDSENAADELRRVAQPWQLESLGYRHRLGEVRYASDFYARPLRRLRFYAGEIQPDGKIIETTNDQVKEIASRIRDPGGGTQGLTTQYGRLMFCTGEALLTNQPEHVVEDALVPEGWEMLSTAELRGDLSGKTFMRYPAGGQSSQGEPLPEGSRVYRIWQRDTMYSALADAPMRAVLDLCEELAILTLVIRARAISRLAGNGILFIPNEITLPGPKPVVGAENPKEDPFLTELIKAILAPIEDQGSAGSVSPLLVRGPADAGEKIKHVTLRTADEAFPENALREQTIERLGIGLDMPMEALTGTGGINHWGSWQIERDGWRHAEPVAKQYVDDITAAYFRPTLIAEGIATPELYVYAFDASEILTNPDRGEDAKAALGAGAIGYEAYREAMGWPDEAAPKDEAEIEMMLRFLGKVPTDPNAAPTAAAPAGGTDAEPGPPAEEQPTSTAPADGGGGTDNQVAALIGAAEMAVLRHREGAGAKLRGKANACPPCKETIDGLANSLVAATLGVETCADLGATSAAALVSSKEPLFTIAAERIGLNPAVAGALAKLVEDHAALTLFDDRPAPFPDAAIRAVLSRRAR